MIKKKFTQLIKLTVLSSALLVFCGCSVPPDPPEPSGKRVSINSISLQENANKKGHLVSDLSDVTVQENTEFPKELNASSVTVDTEIDQRLHYRK